MNSSLGTGEPRKSPLDVDITTRYLELRAEIAAAAERCGRTPESVRIVAVTKSADEQVLAPLLQNGCCDFAENRWQDARVKLDFANKHLPTSIRWHFIGRLQLNKVKYVVPNFSWVHSVDSLALAQAISGRAAAEGRVIKALVQVNVSGEATKTGFSPEEVEPFLRKVQGLPGVEWQGLMTMAPHAEDVEETRPWFRALRELSLEVRRSLSLQEFRDLSMGMSNDFAVAIEEGATLIRVGRRLVGERVQPQNL
ncbi:YggS family pyridoxal phosphate-dependent enzyme [Alicyclobacillus sp. ALC3]|uniref:YggS family pyridoxal phosphate-dependent enzyme n=1 Tax=Alicyclobacillus sp. ALC3 TaxID=2796143 RepID=UPI0030838AF4